MKSVANSFVAISLITIISGCRNAPEFQLYELDPKIVLHVRMLNGNQSVDINEEFIDDRGYRLRFDDLSFYISNVVLLTNGGKAIALNDVILFDFTEVDHEGNTNKFTRSYPFIIPPGDYKSIRFDLGLPADLNASDPTTYPTNDPLRGTEMYWTWATKYRFIRMGMKLISNDTTQFDFDMQIHTGLDTMFIADLNRQVSLPLESFQKDTLFLDIDWNKIFHASDSIDLSEKIFTHGTESQSDRDICYKFSHNFANAISAYKP